MKQILFLLPYPTNRAPSQRFRVEAYFGLLEASGFQIRICEFLDEAGWRILYENGNKVGKILAVLGGLAKRFKILTEVHKYDYVFIHREAAPIGPPLFEWVIAKLLKRKIIFDYDDAIWIPKISHGNRLAAAIKCFWKVQYICRWAHTISAGNPFLAAFAKRFNTNIVIIPTAVDITNRYVGHVDHFKTPVTIGWTGSHSTLPYFESLAVMLNKVVERTGTRIVVICDKPPANYIKNLHFVKWDEKSEIQDLMEIQVGLMPLTPDEWSEGKCGFKIIQYLALGIPALASPVGVNKSIIDHGKNGFLCNSEQEWEANLELLVQDAQARNDYGKHGKAKVATYYSTQANAGLFLSLFD